MKIADSNGGTNFTLPVSNGLLRPEHVKRMAAAVWLELLLEDMVSSGQGDDGIVLKGQPVCDRELAARLGVSERTIARYRGTLVGHYIIAERKSTGYVYRVLKSKKWALIRQSRSDKLVQSDQTNLSSQAASDRTQTVKRSDTNGRSNKETKPGLIEKQQQAAPTTLREPWKVLGVQSPIGHPQFQNDWEEWWHSSTGSGKPAHEIAEEFIQFRQQRGQKIPRPFFEAKRRIEAHGSPGASATEGNPLAAITGGEIPPPLNPRKLRLTAHGN
jgi:hypothetical protein